MQSFIGKYKSRLYVCAYEVYEMVEQLNLQYVHTLCRHVWSDNRDVLMMGAPATKGGRYTVYGVRVH